MVSRVSTALMAVISLEIVFTLYVAYHFIIK
jgi:hypothetical protein